MGKKKKGELYESGNPLYPKEKMKMIDTHLSEYVDAIENLLIPNGKDVEEFKKSVKTVKKACKNLREGKPEKVFDEDAFIEEFGEDDDY